MFCEKCGKEMPEGTAFCNNCGNNLNAAQKAPEKIEDNQILLSAKSTFKFLYQIGPLFISFGFIILMCSIPFFISSVAAGIFVMFFLLMLLGIILIIKVLINQKQYDSYTYDFYKTKVIYKDSFINLSEKEVKYKHIREVTMRQTFIQRYFNIGTIILYTNAETGIGNGIFIVSVENVKDVYTEIKSIIDV